MLGDRTNYGKGEDARSITLRVYGKMKKAIEREAKSLKVTVQDVIQELLDAKFPGLRQRHQAGGEDREGAGRGVDRTRQQKRRAAQSAAKGAKAGDGKARRGPRPQEAIGKGRGGNGRKQLPSGKPKRQPVVSAKPRRVDDSQSPKEEVKPKRVRKPEDPAARKARRKPKVIEETVTEAVEAVDVSGLEALI